ncbi:MAG: carboxypeptidase regulatory-like domain-containing protein, partial [Dehalococcoidia bacterium]|nr:carboxypeptidase regulatory-like domain-containing protein [Dehalococcoidia bacterium]
TTTLSLLVVLILLMLPNVTPVLANGGGYGNVQGNVQDANTGSPIAGAKVMLFDAATFDPNTSVPVAESGSTGGSGNYLIFEAPAGDYIIVAKAPGYITEYYPEATKAGDAVAQTLTSAGLSDIDFELEVGGSISGTVARDMGGWEGDQIVIAWTADTLELVAWTFSGASGEGHGEYTLTDLPFGDYKVSAGGAPPQGIDDPGTGGSSLMRGWWSQDGTESSPDDADVITIDSPTPVENIEFYLEQGGQIELYIRDESGSGLNGATVTLEDYDTGEVIATTTSYERDCGSGCSDFGYARFNGLDPDNSYLVWATAPGRVIRYAEENTNGTYDRNQATSYQVTEGGSTWISDITLPYGGSISGVVYESDGTTVIENATVMVDNGDSGGGDSVSTEVTTDSSGGYTVAGIPFDSYIVSAMAAGSVTEYYSFDSGSVVDPEQADEVTISPGQVDITDIDFSLDAGGTISGTITNESGQPLENVWANALPAAMGGGDGDGQESPWDAETDESGNYTIIGLPFDDYKVFANGGKSSQYVSEWYDDESSYENAATVSLTSGTPDAAGIDFALAIGGSISGVVTPVDQGGWMSNARVTVYDSVTGNKIAEGGTMEDGMTYLISGIPTGSYYVRARADNRAFKYYNNAYSKSTATLVQVTAPSITLNINFSLPQGVRIQGNVWISHTGQALEGALVTAYFLGPLEVPEEDFDDIAYTQTTDEWGSFNFDYLPEGYYKIGARGGEGQMYLPQYWNDYEYTTSWDEAGVKTMDEYNNYWQGHFNLNQACLVTGTVYEEDGITSKAGAFVFANDPGAYGDGGGPPPSAPPDGSGSGSETGPWASTITEADGSYELYCPSDKGSFIVGAQAEGYVRMFFQDTFDPDEAQRFDLNYGEQAGGINFSLSPAGTISGMVYDAASGVELTGTIVNAVDKSTGVPFEAYVNEDGTYTIDNLPFGEYIVMAMGDPANEVTRNYAMEWWQETTSDKTATPVVVSESTQAVTGVDFTLEPGGSIEGRVRHEHGWDINGALVTLYTAGGTELMNTWSNGWEGYKFMGVPSGDYKVSAWYVEPQGHSNTQRRFYNNQNTLAEADLVTVTAPGAESGIDFNLPQANGQISGIVMYAGSLQPGDYEEVVVVARPVDADAHEGIYFATSMPNLGSYQLNNVADGNYIMIAFLDIDGNQQPDAGEPYGFYGDPTTVILTSTPENPSPQVPGTSIVIMDQAQGIILGEVAIEGKEDYSGATVTAGTYTTTTAADGSYSLSVTPDTYTVTITMDGYLPAVSSDVYVTEILSSEPAEMPLAFLLHGDTDASGAIDIADLVSVTVNLGTAGPDGDLNGDGTVDVLDLVPIGRNFGRTNSLWLEEGESLPEPSPASGTPSFGIDLSSQSLAPGDALALEVMVEDVSGLYAAEFHLTFDESLLEAQDADASIGGNQLTPSDDLFPFVSGDYYTPAAENLYYYSYSAGDGGYFIAQCQADNTDGKGDYIIVLLSPVDEDSADPVSADAEGAAVATIVFNCLAEGEAEVDFAGSPKLADTAGDLIAVESYDGATITIEIPPPEISDIQVSNITDRSFTVSWITNVDTTGQVSYGTSGAMGDTADDDRGGTTEDDTHHVTISSLVANTTYYFDVVSGVTTDDNSGAHYTVTTGPGLDFKMPEMISGTAYQMDGSTPAEGAILYATIGTSQVLSGLVNSNGTWGLNIAAVRAADYQTYYSHSDSDDILLEVNGGGVVGSAEQTITIAQAKVGAPAMTLVPNYAPAVENVTTSQYSGTGTISIEYDVSDQDEEDTSIDVSFAYWNGSTYVDCTTVTGDGAKTISTSPTHYTATWDAKTDFDGQYMTTLKIKVLADDGNVLGVGNGISSEFTLDTLGPTGIAPSSPADGATEVELSPTLAAVAATDPSSPVFYYFLIAKDADFTTGVQESGWLSATTWIPLTRLDAPTVDYWWKVKAKDSFGNVTESDAFTLTTLAVVPIDVTLVDGWNIIALATEPTVGYTASTLAADINDQGGNISQVFWWNAQAGGWDFYLVDIQYGTDFNIEVGYGYLLKNTTPATWTYWGVPLSADYSATVEPRVSNVGAMSFTVSWISQSAEQGYVNYGTSAESLTPDYDDRGQATSDDTHHVTIS